MMMGDPATTTGQKAGSVVVLRYGMLLLRAVYAFAAVILITLLSYLFGHGQLESHLSGNDIPWALSMAQWYSRWFPEVPIWYPLQGGGTPLLFLYQPGTSFLVILISRILDLSVIQAFRLLGFLSIPICGIGIYMLVWAKTRSQTVALIAGLMYPLSTATWDWLVRVGLYAQSVTIMFFPWALLVFDAYLSSRSAASSGGARSRGPFLFALSAFMFGLMFVSHIPTALVFVMAITGYAAVLAAFELRGGNLWRAMARTIVKAWLCILVGLLLVGAWLLPFIQANGLANREGLSYIPAEMVSYYDFATTLGLVPPDANYGMTFPVLFTVLAVVGVMAGLLRRESPASWGILAIGSVLFVAMPGLWIGFVRFFAPLWAATNDRAVLAAMVLVPAAAALGASGIARALAYLPLKALTGGLNRVMPKQTVKKAVAAVRGVAIAAMSLVVFGLAVMIGPKVLPELSRYGPRTGDGMLPLELDDGTLVLPDPPMLVLSDQGDLTNRADILAFSSEFRFDQNTRLDVSPNMGGITEALSLYSDASIINIYGFNASLIHGMWGYLTKVFYTEPLTEPNELNQLAKWFGLQYIVLHRMQDPIERYELAGWPQVYPDELVEPGIVQVRQNPGAPGLATTHSGPVVLVIGGFENAIYEQAFRTFVRGGFPYEDGLVVEGTHFVDDYSTEVLSSFDVVYLHGYGYRNQAKAWQILTDYVNEGGGLFIDTGWQYFTPDWELRDAPEFMPVPGLVWGDYGKATDFVVSDPLLSEAVRLTEFSPLAWEDAAWGVSASSGDLRQWARAFLSVDGHPLVAGGELGEGRVIWSGMNLIGHSLAYDNQEERTFLREMLTWLVRDPQRVDHEDPIISRLGPDHIQLELTETSPDPTWLLWREAFAPQWHAEVTVGAQQVSAPIFRSGPGMMLIRLPAINQAGSTLDLQFNLGWIGTAGLATSALAAVGLACFVLAPGAFAQALGGQRKKRSKWNVEGMVPWMLSGGIAPVPEEPPRPTASGNEGDQAPLADPNQSPGDPLMADGALVNPDEIDRFIRGLAKEPHAPNGTTTDAQGMITWWRKNRQES